MGIPATVGQVLALVVLMLAILLVASVLPFTALVVGGLVAVLAVTRLI